MPIVEPVEYDTFDYKHFDEPALSIEDAVKKAEELRRSDNSKFHRIVPTDSTMSAFRVESLSMESVYAEALSRWTALLNKFTMKATKR